MKINSRLLDKREAIPTEAEGLLGRRWDYGSEGTESEQEEKDGIITKNKKKKRRARPKEA